MNTFFKNLHNLVFLLVAVVMGSCGNNDTTTDANMNEYESTSQMRNLTADSVNSTTLQDMQTFVTKAYSDGLMEIQAAELAMEKGHSEAVKQLAATIKTDHARANEKLKKITESKKWEIPTTMLEDHEMKMAELRASEGGAFDDVYLSMMEEGHRKAIDMFNDALGIPLTGNVGDSSRNELDTVREESMVDASVANDIPKHEDAGMYEDKPFPDKDLTNWIRETLPALQKHLKRTREAQNKIT